MGGLGEIKHPTLATLGFRIYYARRRMGMKQIELALCIDRSPSMVCLYEHGKRWPDITTLIKLADALMVSTDFLLGREDIKCESLKTGSHPT